MKPAEFRTSIQRANAQVPAVLFLVGNDFLDFSRNFIGDDSVGGLPLILSWYVVGSDESLEYLLAIHPRDHSFVVSFGRLLRVGFS